MSSLVIPTQGQLVEVRQRPFVVTDVQQGALPNDYVHDRRPAQHLVTLSSVEDDALGESLQVIWEIEPGARVFQKSELPEITAFDDPVRLDAFLDAARWGAISTADHRNVQSPFRSGIEIEDYQLDPVVRAVQMHRVCLLIADDVGLGKTIESGLVIQELILRNRTRKVLIVCPSDLQIQWQEQMRDKFGLEFRIVDSEAMKQLRRRRGIHVNPWNHFPRLITSMDYLKRERPLRLFRELLPAEGESVYPRRFDLLLVDESHNIAPAGSQYYAVDSQRTEMVRMLAQHFEHKLFLTATPHNGYPESFTALLELLDNQRFARGVAPDRNQLDAVMVRRMKTEIKDWDGRPKFPERKITAVNVKYTPEEIRIHDALREYTGLCRERAKTRTEKFSAEFVLKLLKKRLFSSPAAFATTLAQHIHTVSQGGRKQAAASDRLLEKQIEQRLLEDFADDQVYEETEADVVATTSALFQHLSEDQIALLEEMRVWAERAAWTADSKAMEMIALVQYLVRPNGRWNHERVIIFTEYRTTQKWLTDLLAAEGLTADGRLRTLYGGMNSDEREAVKAAFQAHPGEAEVRILLSTDAASEGVNLQNHCRHLIHYEIPWNPNRMEQRNGRIDRHGQRSRQVFVYHFVGQDYIEQSTAATRPGKLDGDLEFLMRAAIKVQNIREDLGKVGPVIAAQIEEAMLGKRAALDTARAEKDSEAVRRMLRFERKVNEQIERLREQLQETRRSLRLSPENVETVVRIGLELAGQPALAPLEVPDLKGRAFQLPQFQGSWAACGEGILHPHSRRPRPVVFDDDLARGRDDLVLLHLNHRLVRMCLSLLRAEVWSTANRKKLNRATVRVVPNSALDHPAIIAFGRLVVLGADQQRLHEEIVAAGGVIREGRFNRMNVGEVERALEAAGDETPGEAMGQRLIESWPKYAASAMQSLEARMKDRTKGLEKFLQDRAGKEIADITTILTELQKAILQELEIPEETEQLSFFAEWSEEERDQRERDLDALRLRLEKIPAEIEQETAAIRKRFADPEP
ncbi:MAG: DISARM system SNF2-like helicase DrmD, partial [Blastocatellia bacterium]